MKRKPLDKSRAWPLCDLCHEATPFLFRWCDRNSCIPCYEEFKVLRQTGIQFHPPREYPTVFVRKPGASSKGAL